MFDRTTGGWQPIDSAPRDGREIAARASSGGCWVVTWLQRNAMWQIKAKPGRDPITYLIAIEWKPL